MTKEEMIKKALTSLAFMAELLRDLGVDSETVKALVDKQYRATVGRKLGAHAQTGGVTKRKLTKKLSPSGQPTPRCIA